ncbi:MAG: ectoine hydroxylase-related dioxygenase (phytanoyl-CoA dioxygenase family) [Halieaceae bacterium]|jgi:ectoine hydroxylase-related dioxygenase (phytanoyl-CoA dioxygenase family)
MDRLEQLENNGYFVRENVLSTSILDRLRAGLERATERCQDVQRNTGVGEFANPPEPSLSGSAHHILTADASFVDLLKEDLSLDIIEHYLGGKLILNNYGGFTNAPSTSTSTSYSHGLSIHRDVRTFTCDYGKQLVEVLVALDDFTQSNGATFFLPGSHLQTEKPSEEVFFEHSSQAEMAAGSILVFDARLWHAAGENTDTLPRRALTIGFTRPFFKPQFDYCRAMGDENTLHLPEALRQLVGFNSRIPASHEQWYQPGPRRFYKGDG